MDPPPESEAEVSPFPDSSPLAIVGIACRFPGGADDPASFWRLLRDGVDAITEVPPDRWTAGAFYSRDPLAPERTVTRWGGFVRHHADFDAAFFGIAPREARCLDPQQRWMLELAWEAMEDAGLPPERARGARAGVFVGASGWEYSTILSRDLAALDLHSLPGTVLSNIANRVSYLYDLRGPSLGLDTACSSSLVAFHLACESLRRGECDLALAGGINTLMLPDTTLSFGKAGLLSPTGRCHAFDARADGYVRAEGAAFLLLKPLPAALADADRIYAVVLATAVNQDGRTSSLTVPSVEAQTAMLRAAYAAAGVDPATVRYVEAHGTGTQVGDPVEAEAISAVLCRDRPADRPCLLGSVKTNIGHLEAGSGVAGIAKVALMLRHGLLAPTLHFQSPNPRIPLDAWRLRVVTELGPLPGRGEGAVAGVNSFGFGGTNAHVVLREHVPPAPATAPAPPAEEPPIPRLFAVSARDPAALAAYERAYADFLAARPDATLADVCHSAALRKASLPCRSTVVASTRDEAVAELRRRAERRARGAAESVPPAAGQGEPRVAFVFSGQGSQWAGMGRGLLDRCEAFRAFVAECDRHFAPLAGWTIRDALLADEAHSRLRETAVAQPAIFAVQTGIARLLESWGLPPAAVVGHSVGEVAAAHVAGAHDLADALRIVFHRSRLQQRCHGRGAMAVVGLPAADAHAALAPYDGAIEIAAVNAPDLVTVSGDAEAVAALERELGARKVLFRSLGVDYAFHSRQMEPIRDELLAALADLRGQAPRLPFYSTATGARLADAGPDAAYWWRNVRQTVRFHDAARAAAAETQPAAFVEIGPHPTLQRAIRDSIHASSAGARLYSTLQRGHDDLLGLFHAVAGLHERGATIRWEAVLAGQGQPGRFVSLPPYPWQRTRHWKECRRSVESRFPAGNHPLLGRRLSGPTPEWESTPGLATLPYLRDHAIRGNLLFPAAGVLEMASAALREYAPNDTHAIEDIEILAPLPLSDAAAPRLRTTLEPETCALTIRAEELRDGASAWYPYARARYRRLPAAPPPPAVPATAPAGAQPITADALYRWLAARGYGFGPAFRQVQQVHGAESESLGSVAAGESIRRQIADYLVHPAMLDGCFQCLLGIEAVRRAQPEGALYVPSRVERFVFHGRGALPQLASAVTLRSATDREIVADLTIRDAAGAPVAELRGFRLARVQSAARPADCLYRLEWRPAPEAPDSAPATGANALLLCDEPALAAALADELRRAGHAPVVARRGPQFRRDDAGSRETPATCAADIERLLKDLDAAGQAPACVLCLWGLTDRDNADASDPPAEALAGTGALLAVVQALHRQRRFGLARFVVATRGAQVAGDATEAPSPAQAALWGFGRVVANEYPEWNVLLADLDPREPASPAKRTEEEAGTREPSDGRSPRSGAPATEDRGGRAEAAALVRAALTPGPAGEIAFRAGRRLECVLARAALHDLPPASRAPAAPPAFRLVTTTPGPLDNLRLRQIARRAPGPDEVEIEVAAAGLNFRDVLKAMGSYPIERAEDEWLGDECAGTVVAVGRDVRDLKPGDEAMALAPGAFASPFVAPAARVARKPAGLSLEQAACVPVAFLTAWHALVDVGRLAAGERVLIHAAAGGVGQAALQIARRLGAEVFATAGSEAKRALLRQQGARGVYDSRSLEFVDGVRESTGGAGVDVVLNSLAGEFIPAGLATLAPYGRFLELGKRDIYSGGRVDLGAFKRNVSFAAIDLAQWLRDRPAQAAAALREIVERFADGSFSPPAVERFPVARAVEAFRHMAQARHVGKIALTFDAGTAASVERNGPPIRPDASYLVVGGLGGFGLEAARWLAAHGARRLVLLTRQAQPPYDAAVQAALDAMARGGVEIAVERGDVAARDPVRRIFAEADARRRPIRGVLHAAMRLDDAFAAELDVERLRAVLAPKVDGAWRLHLETRGRELDFFILFSSISAWLGTVGQANYAAANAFLDALAEVRARAGLPALAVNWGAIGDVGYLARHPRVREHLAQTAGMEAMSARESLAWLDALIHRGAAGIGVFRVDAARLKRHYPNAAKLAALEASAPPAADAAAGGDAVADIRAAPDETREELILAYLRRHLARVSGLAESAVNPDLRLADTGLDSLMGFELVTRIESDFGLTLTASRVMRDSPTLRRLAGTILAHVRASAAPSGQGNG
jgi:acyl transferase domain-containing protein